MHVCIFTEPGADATFGMKPLPYDMSVKNIIKDSDAGGKKHSIDQ